MTDYEPPTIRQMGSKWTGNYELAPGVTGYAVEEKGLIYIPIINAINEGSGEVGAFIDSLSPRCRIPAVISTRLMGMLERRGWESYEQWDDLFEEYIQVWKQKEQRDDQTNQSMGQLSQVE